MLTEVITTAAETVASLPVTGHEPDLVPNISRHCKLSP